MDRWPPLVLLALVACAPGAEPAASGTTAGRVGPAYPLSAVLEEIERSSGELYEPAGADNACETRFTSYGSDDPPAEVARFYEREGFVPKGAGGRLPAGVFRWIGERPGDEAGWRRVDVADGRTAGNERWATAYTVFAPNCDPQAQGSDPIGPTPAAT